jgi:hypothetical protein
MTNPAVARTPHLLLSIAKKKEGVMYGSKKSYVMQKSLAKTAHVFAKLPVR